MIAITQMMMAFLFFSKKASVLVTCCSKVSGAAFTLFFAITQFSLKTTIAPDEAVTIMRDGNNAEIGRFTGTYVAETVIPDAHLFLNANKFYYSKGLSTSKAYRAYFWMQDLATSGANILMGFDGETTDINTVQGSGFKVNGYYDLQGRKVAQPTMGIYIQNGKKLIK